jgi:protocatechuate 4,5-dioxygenase beta chain
MAEIVGGFLLPHVPLIASSPEMPPPDKRNTVRAGFAHLSARLDELRVDTMVIIGDDHYTIFGPQCLPRCLIGIGDLDGPVEPWLGIERQTLRNDSALAEHIMTVGFEQGVDWSVSKSLTLDHSVMVPYHFSGSAGKGQGRQVVPIYLSCAVEPFLSSSRARTIGAITGDAIRSFAGSRRVAVLGTGGLSHWVGMARMGDVNEDWDRRVLDWVQRRDLDALVHMTDQEIIDEAGNGALEIKNWIFAMAAIGNVRCQLISYTPVTEWVSGCGFVELLAA